MCKSTLHKDKNKSLTTLFDVSKQQYTLMKSNSIHVSGMRKSKGIAKGQKYILYYNVSYVSSISTTKKKVDIGEKKWYKYVNLAKIKRWYV